MDAASSVFSACSRWVSKVSRKAEKKVNMFNKQARNVIKYGCFTESLNKQARRAICFYCIL